MDEGGGRGKRRRVEQTADAGESDGPKSDGSAPPGVAAAAAVELLLKGEAVGVLVVAKV